MTEETEEEFKERKGRERVARKRLEWLAMIEIVTGPGTKESVHRRRLVKRLKELAGE